MDYGVKKIINCANLEVGSVILIILSEVRPPPTNMDIETVFGNFWHRRINLIRYEDELRTGFLVGLVPRCTYRVDQDFQICAWQMSARCIGIQRPQL